MNMHFVVKRALLTMCLLAIPALGGCQTVAGFGRDVQQAGRWISGGAERTQTWAFGPQPESQNTASSTSATDTSSQTAMTPAARVPDARGNVVYFASGSAHIPPDGMKEIQSIATASDHNSGQSSGNTSTQTSNNSSAQGSGGNSGPNTGNNSVQSASNSTGQNSGNNSGPSTRRFEVVGYTDAIGSPAYNRRLSQRRAEAVADALAAGGVPRNSIDVQWHGEDQLPIPTADNVPEPQNRRVAITMTGG